MATSEKLFSLLRPSFTSLIVPRQCHFSQKQDLYIEGSGFRLIVKLHLRVLSPGVAEEG